jgi:hypothetical protein
MVYDITFALFGEEHPATHLAADVTRFIPNLVYPEVAWQPEGLEIELVDGFDRSSVTYIA